MIRRIASDKWPRTGYPLLPNPYRDRWFDEPLPPALCVSAGIPAGSHLGILDASVWEQVRSPDALVPVANYLVKLVTGRLYHGGDPEALTLKIHTEDSRIGEFLDEAAFAPRTLNSLRRDGAIEDVDWHRQATAKDVLNLHGAGAMTLLDYAVVAEVHTTGSNSDGFGSSEDDRIGQLSREIALLASDFPLDHVTTADARIWPGRAPKSAMPVDEYVTDLARHGTVEDALSEVRRIRSVLDHIKHEDVPTSLDRVARSIVGDKRLRPILMRLGWDGRGGATLQQAAEADGISRERVRQLDEKIRQASSRIAYIPALDRAIEVYEAAARHLDPSPRTALQREGLAPSVFEPEGIVSAAEIFDRAMEFVVNPSGPLLLRNDSEGAEELSLILKTLTDVNHVAPLPEVQARVMDRSGVAIEDDELRALLDRTGEITWLDPDHRWLWDGRETRYINMARKILSLTNPIPLETLRGGVLRHHRTRNMSLPRGAFRGLCRVAGFDVIGDLVSVSPRIKQSHVLSGIETTMVSVLEDNECVISTQDFRNECVDRGVNRHSFWLYLSYSPVLERLAPGVYTIRGRQVDPALVAEVTGRSPTPTRSLQDHGWTKDGAVWLSYEVTSSVLDAGVVALPSAIGRIIGENRYEIFAVDGSAMGTLATKGHVAWGLSSFIGRRGVDVGDYVVVTIDTELGVALVLSGSADLAVTFEEGEGWGPRYYLETVTDPGDAA